LGKGKVIQHDLHGRVAYELGTEILRGDFPPASTLPREAELMERFGVSRTVLREALRTLTSKVLIESRPKIGTRVRPQQAWNLLDADVLEWYSRVAKPLLFAIKLQEMREMIEPYAAALAAGNRDDAALVRLSEAHQAMLDELLVPLGTLIERTLEAQLRLNARRAEVFNASMAEHTAVFDAIVARDSAAARDAMGGLLGVTRARIEG
jgi:DNA-binding FadR family transcriptional regulator